MAAVLTSDERLRRVDRTVEEVKQIFMEAVAELAESADVASPLEARFAEIGKRLRELPGELEPSLFDRDQLHELHSALHETRDLMQELPEAGDRLDVLDRLLVRIEVIRHIIRDAIDEHVSGIGDDAAAVVAQLEQWLPSIPQHEIARLAGVDRRTVARWAKEHRPPRRRLQLVAQLVAVLRHSWTEEGVVAWFDRPNRELGDRRPIAVLDDAARERDLLMAARATRSQYGT